MLAYLDICCLKRPFDDLAQDRIRIESEAVLCILNASPDRIELLHLAAQDVENDRNPLEWRADRTRQLLQSWRVVTLDEEPLLARTRELIEVGFRNFDALHLASAELARADVFVTCDDRLLAAASRNEKQLSLSTRVVNPITLVGELEA